MISHQLMRILVAVILLQSAGCVCHAVVSWQQYGTAAASHACVLEWHKHGTNALHVTIHRRKAKCQLHGCVCGRAIAGEAAMAHACIVG